MDSESKTAMDWDQHYQDKHTPWDKGAPAPPLLEWIAANPDALNGRILVPGCGGGHDVRALAATGIEDVLGFDISPAAIAEAKSHSGSGVPNIVLMKTEMGKGVDFMEGTHKWHGIAPNDEQLADALSQLEETLGDY